MDNLNSLKNDAQIQRKRRILITILCISYILWLCWSISQSVKLFNDPTASIILAILSDSIFYGINLYFAYQYCSLGLHIFAWLRIILVIFLGLTLIILTLCPITATAIVFQANAVDTPAKDVLSPSTSLIYGTFVFGILTFILDIIAIAFHFKLVRLIDGI